MNETFILMPLMLIVVLALDRYLKWNATRAEREQRPAEKPAAPLTPPQEGEAARHE